MTSVISIPQTKRNFGKFVSQANLGKTVILTRKKKPVAITIGAQEFSQFIEFLEKHDPGLADTLAIMSNPEIQAVLEEDEHNAGQAIPFDKRLLDDDGLSS